MIFISILTLIVAKALPFIYKTFFNTYFIRISAIVFLYAGVLSLNTLNLQSIESGIGIFSGLFHITNISVFIEFFLLQEDSIILTLIVAMPQPLSTNTSTTSNNLNQEGQSLNNTSSINEGHFEGISKSNVDVQDLRREFEAIYSISNNIPNEPHSLLSVIRLNNLVERWKAPDTDGFRNYVESKTFERLSKGSNFTEDFLSQFKYIFNKNLRSKSENFPEAINSDIISNLNNLNPKMQFDNVEKIVNMANPIWNSVKKQLENIKNKDSLESTKTVDALTENIDSLALKETSLNTTKSIISLENNKLIIDLNGIEYIFDLMADLISNNKLEILKTTGKIGTAFISFTLVYRKLVNIYISHSNDDLMKQIVSRANEKDRVLFLKETYWKRQRFLGRDAIIISALVYVGGSLIKDLCESNVNINFTISNSNKKEKESLLIPLLVKLNNKIPPYLKNILISIIFILIIFIFNIDFIYIKFISYLIFALYLSILMYDVVIIYKMKRNSFNKEEFIPKYIPSIFKKIINNHILDLEEICKMEPTMLKLWLEVRAIKIFVLFSIFILTSVFAIFIPYFLFK